MKLLVFAIDALDPAYIRKWLDSMPFIQSLMNKSIMIELDSSAADSYANWTSIYTGQTPDEHNTSGAARDEPAIPESFKSLPFIWQGLAEQGLSSGLTNPIMINKEVAERLYEVSPDSWILSSHIATPQRFIGHLAHYIGYPPIIFANKEITDNYFADDTMTNEEIGEALGPNYALGCYGRFLIRNLENMTNIINANKISPVDFGLFYEVGIDVIQHYSSHSEDGIKMIRRAYITLSAIMEAMCNAIQPEHVVIVSDHGSDVFGSNRKCLEGVNELTGMVSAIHGMPGLLIAPRNEWTAKYENKSINVWETTKIISNTILS